MTATIDLVELTQLIKQWGQYLGFQQVGIASIDLSTEEPHLQAWLDSQYHGDMAWMADHGMLRARPHELLPGAQRVISVRMNYLPAHAALAHTLNNPHLGYISRYALGRDYHKVIRQKLKQLGQKIQEYCQRFDQPCHYRPFVDSAPILERPLAVQAGLGWTGKHTLLIHPDAGSWFFLGELLIDLPLPVDQEVTHQCRNCVACITICPTQAITAPYIIDARRCISYLTIEFAGVIPVELRPLIGNRIYGCDDCQAICPWNRYAQLSVEPDFLPRSALHTPQLLELYAWDEQQFQTITAGTPIRRIGYLRWLRNITIALGNAPYQPEIMQALTQKRQLDPMLDEHITWALNQQQQNQPLSPDKLKTPKQKRLITAIERGLSRDA